MSMREYKFWRQAATVSLAIWVALIFFETISIFSALIGGTIGCMCFYYWIRILSPSKNVRLSFIISVLVTILLNKIMGIYWLVAILISIVMMFLISYIALYVTTRTFTAEEKKKRKMPLNCEKWYRDSLRRLYR